MNRMVMFGAAVVLAGLVVLGTGCDDKLTTTPMEYVGWAVGGNVDGYGTILKTEDGGATWVRQGDAASIPDVQLQAVSVVDDQNVWVVGNPSEADGPSYGTILHTTDGGQTWTRQGDSTTIPNDGFSCVAALDAQTAWVVSFNGYILKTTDAGATWVQKQQDTLTDGNLEGVYAYEENLVWAAGQDSGESGPPVILHTSDGGNAWVRQGQDTLPYGSGIIDMHGLGPNTVWVVGVDNLCYLTTDGGENWVAKREPGGMRHNNGVCAVNKQVAWLAVDYSVALFTHNTGDTWTEQTTPGAGAFCVNLKVTAMDGDTVWMTSNSAGPSTIIHTADGGENWVMQLRTDSAGLGNIGLEGISFVGAAR